MRHAIVGPCFASFPGDGGKARIEDRYRLIIYPLVMPDRCARLGTACSGIWNQEEAGVVDHALALLGLELLGLQTPYK